MKVIVNKVTDESLVRLAASFTIGSESKLSLEKAYASEHSIIRTQMFAVECHDIFLFVSTHLLRHHVGSVPFQLTCRSDRKGGNVRFPERMAEVTKCIDEGRYEEAKGIVESLAHSADRHTPVNLLLFLNAQSLIDMAKVRLCNKASSETREVFKKVVEGVSQVDKALVPYLVRKCVYRGGICGEMRCCGYNQTEQFREELTRYKNHF